MLDSIVMKGNGLRLIKFSDEWSFSFPEEMVETKVFEEYWEAIDYLDFDEKECQKRLRKLVKRFPECYLDAYNHLSISYRNQQKTAESFHYALTSYLLGKNAFPPNFDQDKDEILWVELDNRPFLRACQILGLEYQYIKNFPRAIEIYKENLLYNKDDNQGIRYLLLECYFEVEDFKNVKTLLDKYADDYSVEFLYGQVIYDLLKNKGSNSEALLIKATKCNQHLTTELSKDIHIKPKPHRIAGEPSFDAGIPVGSIQEAFEYWERNKKVLNKKIVRDFFKYTAGK